MPDGGRGGSRCGPRSLPGGARRGRQASERGCAGRKRIRSICRPTGGEPGQASGWLLYANVLEPHKAYVASGDAHALAGDFAAARKDFASALSANPGFDECKVRVNLALSIEKLGDAAVEAQTPDAGTLFAEALAVVQESPPACRHEGPANADGEGDALDSAEARLVRKKAGSGASEAAASPPPGQSPAPPQQEQLRKLQESAEQAQRERQEGQDRDRYLNGPDNPGVDRPW